MHYLQMLIQEHIEDAIIIETFLADSIDETIDSTEQLALEAGRAVLVSYDDAPVKVHSLGEDGWAIQGETSLLLIPNQGEHVVTAFEEDDDTEEGYTDSKKQDKKNRYKDAMGKQAIEVTWMGLSSEYQTKYIKLFGLKGVHKNSGWPKIAAAAKKAGKADEFTAKVKMTREESDDTTFDDVDENTKPTIYTAKGPTIVVSGYSGGEKSRFVKMAKAADPVRAVASAGKQCYVLYKDNFTEAGAKNHMAHMLTSMSKNESEDYDEAAGFPDTDDTPDAVGFSDNEKTVIFIPNASFEMFKKLANEVHVDDDAPVELAEGGIEVTLPHHQALVITETLTDVVETTMSAGVGGYDADTLGKKKRKGYNKNKIDKKGGARFGGGEDEDSEDDLDEGQFSAQAEKKYAKAWNKMSGQDRSVLLNKIRKSGVKVTNAMGLDALESWKDISDSTKGVFVRNYVQKMMAKTARGESDDTTDDLDEMKSMVDRSKKYLKGATLKWTAKDGTKMTGTSMSSVGAIKVKGAKDYTVRVMPSGKNQGPVLVSVGTIESADDTDDLDEMSKLQGFEAGMLRSVVKGLFKTASTMKGASKATLRAMTRLRNLGLIDGSNDKGWKTTKAGQKEVKHHFSDMGETEDSADESKYQDKAKEYAAMQKKREKRMGKMESVHIPNNLIESFRGLMDELQLDESTKVTPTDNGIDVELAADRAKEVKQLMALV